MDQKNRYSGIENKEALAIQTFNSIVECRILSHIFEHCQFETIFGVFLRPTLRPSSLDVARVVTQT